MKIFGLSSNNRNVYNVLGTTVEANIESHDKLMRDKLKRIEQDYKRYLQTNIDTARSMERVAKEDRRSREAAYYGLMAEIYQHILDNYTLSKSYDKP